MSLWLHEFLSWITYSVSFNNPLGLVALFGLGVLTDIGIPLFFALEVFLLFASYHIGPLSTQVLLIILILMLGRSSGGTILYWFSYFIGEPFINWLNKYFPFLCRGIATVKSRVKNRTIMAVALVRLTPGFLQLPSLATGSMHINFRDFILGLILSSVIYDFTIVLLGYIGRLIVGNNRQHLEELFLISFILLIIGFWIVFYFKYRHELIN